MKQIDSYVKKTVMRQVKDWIILSFIFLLSFHVEASMSYASESYTIRRGDMLDITVMEHPEFTIPNVIVLPDGYIQYPGIGSIPAAGMTINQFTSSMNKYLEKFVVNPIVTVFIKSLPNQVINVVGYVTRPGQIAVFEPMDLVTVISKAGGITNIKKCKEINIIRANQSFEVIKVRDLFNQKNAATNIPVLYVGDTVYVVEPRDFNWSRLSFFTTLGYIIFGVINLIK